jgi:hypothetical protein
MKGSIWNKVPFQFLILYEDWVIVIRFQRVLTFLKFLYIEVNSKNCLLVVGL